MHRDVEAADQMLATLERPAAHGPRQRGRTGVSLKDELEFLQKYLEIEQARFGDRLRCPSTSSPTRSTRQVPNLLLQPLVENSVRHGSPCASSPGTSRSGRGTARRACELVVSDNGPGMPPARSSPEKGVGLANTRSRLEHCTAQPSASFGEPPGGGLVVTVDDPVQGRARRESDDFAEDIKGVA